MSLRTRTWDQLVGTISAYSGVNVSSRPEELTRVSALVNQAALDLHETYPWLERWLVVAEPRTVSRGQIEPTEDSFYVYGAGTGDVNGLYAASGDDYIKTDSDGTTEYTLGAFVDAMVVAGAGTSAVNGTYLRDGDSGGKPHYKFGDATNYYELIYNGVDTWILQKREGLLTNGQFYESFEDAASPELVSRWLNADDGPFYDGASPSPTVRRATLSDTGITAAYVTWNINDSSGTTVYSNTTTQLTPPLTGWAANTGSSPAPLLVDVGEIGLLLAVDRCDVFSERTSRPIQFRTEGGRFVLHERSPPGIAYCTYQKPLTELYGDGTGSTTSDIPQEFFNYMAVCAALELQVANKSSNPNAMYPSISARRLQDAKDSVGMAQEHQGTISNVARRVMTHYQQNNSLY